MKEEYQCTSIPVHVQVHMHMHPQYIHTGFVLSLKQTTYIYHSTAAAAPVFATPKSLASGALTRLIAGKCKVLDAMKHMI